ncbi:hypothetical protein ED263_RS02695 [Enterococcus hirae]|uniref:hypothetical protein n=1 Tax=Enterococcus sp. C63 TaxID=3231324 RepID=UPI0019E666EB|nr:hypothetical protein [Enterococcus hirae]EMF0136796.1 hypothetical protein [Enterococcus hirae]EMF0160214.1 hypothetical protein [Enterococcus hirae]EMF0283301.1 hypothetical protein [Enterococcus hirae]EMF0617925.1 hypothetical protein [Enterococcus hirae]
MTEPEAENHVNLTFKDYRDAVIEAGIGLIPYVGGSIQTLYFGTKNEKRFKRIEYFYKQLANRMKSLEEFDLDGENSEQLVGIIETIHDEIEKSKSHDKIVYFVNAYKNLLLGTKQHNQDIDELYVDILSKVTRIEIEILALYMRNGGKRGIPNIPSVDQMLVLGSLNRLSDFGLLNRHLEGLTVGGDGRQSYTFSLSNLGLSFGQYILH